MCGALKKSEQQDNSVTIRLIQPQDREEVRALLRQLHEKTIFGHMAFSNRKFDVRYDEVLSRPLHSAGMVAVYQNRVIGAIWATVGEHTVSEDGLIATCHLIAVESEPPLAVENGKPVRKLSMGHLTRRATTFLRLLKAVKAWAKSRGTDHVMVHVTTGTVEDGMDAKKTEKLLKKVSAKSVGGAYIV